MTIYDLKPAFQNLLRPACRTLADAGISANQVTVVALVISVVVGTTLAYFNDTRWALALVPAWLFLRMALNAIDGMLAREHGMQSKLGAILNEVSDVVADAALYLPFALVAGFSPMLVTIAVVLALLTEMAGVVGAQVGASRRYDGPLGKSDRAFVFGVLGLLLALGIDLRPYANGVIALVAVLSAITVWNRSAKALAELEATASSRGD